MIASVRHAGIRWFQRIRNHLAQKAVQVLRAYEVHPNTRENLDLGLVVGVPYDGAKAQGDGSVVLPSFVDHINGHWLNGVFADNSELIAECNRLQVVGFNHNDPRLSEMQSRLAFDQLRNRGLLGGGA